jgi:hypothetical protein
VHTGQVGVLTNVIYYTEIEGSAKSLYGVVVVLVVDFLLTEQRGSKLEDSFAIGASARSGEIDQRCRGTVRELKLLIVIQMSPSKGVDKTDTTQMKQQPHALRTRSSQAP